MSIAALVVALLSVGASTASAATTRFVSPTGSDTVPAGNTCINAAQPCKTIARANTVAVAGDTISLSAGTFAEKVNITKAVSVVGAGQAGAPGGTTIGLAAAGTAFIANPGAGNALSINGVRITLGNQTGNFGGGLFALTGTTNVTDTTITGNSALAGGGAVAYTGAALNATRVTFSNNTATLANNGGGGLYVGGTATVTDSTFDTNKATSATNAVGGGVYVAKIVAGDAPSLTLDHSTLTHNTSAVYGGGAAVNTGATLTVKNNSRFDTNSAFLGGGIATLSGSVANVTDSTFTTNTGAGAGGGAILAGSTFNATRTALQSNTSTTAGSGGGGLFVAGTANLTDSTLDSNSGVTGNSYGGGIYMAQFLVASAPTVTLDHTILSNNSAYRGGGVATLAGGSLTVKNGSTFSKNAAGANGGAIYDSALATVTDSTLDQNTAGFEGGGIYSGITAANDTPIVSVANTAITGGTAFIGGGVAVENRGSATVAGGSVAGNLALVGGGVSVNTGGGGQLTDTTISANTAQSGLGGGVYNAGGLNVDHATIDHNRATAGTDTNGHPVNGKGAGIYTATAATITDSALLDNAASNAASGGGGGIALVGTGTVTATGTTLARNTAFVGGGVYTGQAAAGDAPEVTLTDSHVSDSQAVLGGGIAALTPAAVHVNGGDVTGSTANNGGGLYVQEGSSADFTGATLSGNAAGAGNGGAIYNSGTTTIATSTLKSNTATPISGNSSTGFGAGVYSASAPAPAGVHLKVLRSTISGNHAAGAPAIIAGNQTTIDDSTIADNVASGVFGAIVTSGAVLTTASTVHGNSAASGGAGGIVNVGGTYALAGSIVAANTAGTGPRNCSGAIADGGYNLADDATCNLSPPNNDVLAPSKLNGLADNGGPTETKLPMASSPAINKIPPGTTALVADPVSGGTVALCGEGAIDQRGVARPQGPTCDIGAVEIAVEAPTLSGPDHATFVTGQADSVAFTTTGVPTPQITTAGPLPAGVTLDDAGDGTATLHGTPAAGTAGTYHFTVRASNGIDPDATIDFTLLVIDPLEVTTTSLPNGVIGTPYSASLAAHGGVSPYHWSLASGSLPDGLSIADDGTIAGTPTAPGGTSTFTVKVTDSEDPARTATKQLSITVTRTPTVLTADPALVKITDLLHLRVTITNISATLRTAAGAPIAGQTISFTAGSTALCTAVTGADGRARCSGVTLTATLPTLLNLGYTATYAGSPQYEPSSAHGALIGG